MDFLQLVSFILSMLLFKCGVLYRLHMAITTYNELYSHTLCIPRPRCTVLYVLECDLNLVEMGGVEKVYH